MPTIGAQVHLNEAEQRLAKYLATARYQANRKSCVANGRVGPQSDADTDLEGIAGEIAFCKLFNLRADTDTDGRPEHDAILHSGLTVDVKTTTYPHGKLLAVPGKSRKSATVDLFALMTGAFPGPYTFRGFMWRKELLREDRLGTVGHGPTYKADQRELVEV